MRLLISVAVVVVSLAGCRDSKSDAITAAEVTQALRSEGFGVAVVADGDKERLERVFAQDTGQIDDVVAQSSLMASFRPTGRSGVGDLVVAGLVYRHERDATCSMSNVLGVCLHSRNVVIVARDDRAQAARRALAKLD